MDIYNIAQDICNAIRDWHLPFFGGFIGYVKDSFKIKSCDDLGDLGDAPGDNIPPKKILISLSSCRDYPGRF